MTHGALPNARQDESLSRFLCMVLRHKPEVVGIRLDAEGWVSVRDLVPAIRAKWKKCPVSPAIIERIVEADPKTRYELDTRTQPARIRATYGHSLAVRIAYPEVQPPEILYHGTTRRFLWRILREGLTPMGRQYVHLSADWAMAREVGRRRDNEPAILSVDAKRMEQQGHAFFKTPGGLYLARVVPAEFLSVR
jgi:putative RNA 2'-phosphotransferase